MSGTLVADTKQTNKAKKDNNRQLSEGRQVSA